MKKKPWVFSWRGGRDVLACSGVKYTVIYAALETSAKHTYSTPSLRWERDNSRLREEVKSMMTGICESGNCSSSGMLEVLCLVPVVLESSFRLWNDVLVKFQHA